MVRAAVSSHRYQHQHPLTKKNSPFRIGIVLFLALMFVHQRERFSFSSFSSGVNIRDAELTKHTRTMVSLCEPLMSLVVGLGSTSVVSSCSNMFPSSFTGTFIVDAAAGWFDTCVVIGTASQDCGVTGGAFGCDCFCHPNYITSTCGTRICHRSYDCNGRSRGADPAISGTYPSCTCQCLVQYTGSACQNRICHIDVDCEPSNSLSISGSYPACACACRDGYSGTRCQTRSCHVNTDCNGNGLAITGGTYPSCVCACKDGWSGPQCQTRVCHHNVDCNGQGLAMVAGWLFPQCVCVCKKGFGGPRCRALTASETHSAASFTTTLTLSGSGASHSKPSKSYPSLSTSHSPATPPQSNSYSRTLSRSAPSHTNLSPTPDTISMSGPTSILSFSNSRAVTRTAPTISALTASHTNTHSARTFVTEPRPTFSLSTTNPTLFNGSPSNSSELSRSVGPNSTTATPALTASRSCPILIFANRTITRDPLRVQRTPQPQAEEQRVTAPPTMNPVNSSNTTTPTTDSGDRLFPSPAHFSRERIAVFADTAQLVRQVLPVVALTVRYEHIADGSALPLDTPVVVRYDMQWKPVAADLRNVSAVLELLAGPPPAWQPRGMRYSGPVHATVDLYANGSVAIGAAAVPGLLVDEPETAHVMVPAEALFGCGTPGLWISIALIHIEPAPSGMAGAVAAVAAAGALTGEAADLQSMAVIGLMPCASGEAKRLARGSPRTLSHLAAPGFGVPGVPLGNVAGLAASVVVAWASSAVLSWRLRGGENGEDDLLYNRNNNKMLKKPLPPTGLVRALAALHMPGLLINVLVALYPGSLATSLAVLSEYSNDDMASYGNVFGSGFDGSTGDDDDTGDHHHGDGDGGKRSGAHSSTLMLESAAAAAWTVSAASLLFAACVAFPLVLIIVSVRYITRRLVALDYRANAAAPSEATAGLADEDLTALLRIVEQHRQQKEEQEQLELEDEQNEGARGKEEEELVTENRNAGEDGDAEIVLESTIDSVTVTNNHHTNNNHINNTSPTSSSVISASPPNNEVPLFLLAAARRGVLKRWAVAWLLPQAVIRGEAAAKMFGPVVAFMPSPSTCTAQPKATTVHPHSDGFAVATATKGDPVEIRSCGWLQSIIAHHHLWAALPAASAIILAPGVLVPNVSPTGCQGLFGLFAALHAALAAAVLSALPHTVPIKSIFGAAGIATNAALLATSAAGISIGVDDENLRMLVSGLFMLQTVIAALRTLHTVGLVGWLFVTDILRRMGWIEHVIPPASQLKKMAAVATHLPLPVLVHTPQSLKQEEVEKVVAKVEVENEGDDEENGGSTGKEACAEHHFTRDAGAADDEGTEMVVMHHPHHISMSLSVANDRNHCVDIAAPTAPVVLWRHKARAWCVVEWLSSPPSDGKNKLNGKGGDVNALRSEGNNSGFDDFDDYNDDEYEDDDDTAMFDTIDIFASAWRSRVRPKPKPVQGEPHTSTTNTAHVVSATDDDAMEAEVDFAVALDDFSHDLLQDDPSALLTTATSPTARPEGGTIEQREELLLLQHLSTTSGGGGSSERSGSDISRLRGGHSSSDSPRSFMSFSSVNSSFSDTDASDSYYLGNFGVSGTHPVKGKNSSSFFFNSSVGHMPTLLTAAAPQPPLRPLLPHSPSSMNENRRNGSNGRRIAESGDETCSFSKQCDDVDDDDDVLGGTTRHQTGNNNKKKGRSLSSFPNRIGGSNSVNGLSHWSGTLEDRMRAATKRNHQARALLLCPVPSQHQHHQPSRRHHQSQPSHPPQSRHSVEHLDDTSIL